MPLMRVTSRSVQLTRQNRSDPTQPAGLDRFLGICGLSWVTKFFLIVGPVGF